MKYSIIHLTADSLMYFLPEMVLLDREIIADPWQESNFQADLPGKWELSRLVCVREKLIGFMIATFKAKSVHVNRIVVVSAGQCSGIGTQLLCDAAQSALSFQKPLVTLKVSCKNMAAISFYQRRGFIQQGADEQNLTLQVDPHILLAISTSGNS